MNTYSGPPNRRRPVNFGETEVFRDVHFHWATTLMGAARPGAPVTTPEEAAAYVRNLEHEVEILRGQLAAGGQNFARRRQALRHALDGFKVLADDN